MIPVQFSVAIYTIHIREYFNSISKRFLLDNYFVLFCFSFGDKPHYVYDAQLLFFNERRFRDDNENASRLVTIEMIETKTIIRIITSNIALILLAAFT